MIDIHTHLLPNVDDGSDSTDLSISEVLKAQEMGVTDMVFTPHFRLQYRKKSAELKESFEQFKKIAIENGVKINLYLGQEIYVTSKLNKHFADSDVMPINNGKYVLLEFSGSKNDDISEAIYEVKRLGYIPIIAHVERYKGVTIEDIEKAKYEGALIQVNASSFFKKPFKRNQAYHKTKKIMQNNLCDIVASDVHSFRENRLLDAKKLVEKKYGMEIANKLFVTNPQKIL